MRLPPFAYLFPVLCICALTTHAQIDRQADSILNEKMIKLTTPDNVYYEAIKAKNNDDPAHAKELFEQFVALKPGVSAGYYELSKIYYNEKKTSQAEDYIKKAIAIDAHNKWYQEQYASILAEKGDYLNIMTTPRNTKKL